MRRDRQSTRGPSGQALVPASRAPIERNRSEILRLIDKLRASQDPGGADRISATLREQVDRIAPPRAEGGRRRALPAATRRAASEAPMRALPDFSPRASRHILQGIEERLSRIESRLDAVPAAGAGNGSAAPDDSTLRGVIQGEMLSDILQLVSSNDLTGVFTIEGGEQRFELFFREGQIEHARGGGRSGEEAFYAAFALGSGHYVFRETTDLPDDKTVEGNTQFLILEALRQIDEASGDE